MRTYSIRELQEAYGVTSRTLRFYEDKGLLNPKRQGVKRLFSEKDKVRLALTLRGKRLGFSLQEIKEIIELYDPSQPDDPAQILFLCEKIGNHRKELLNKINDIKDTLNLMNDIEQRALAMLNIGQVAQDRQPHLI